MKLGLRRGALVLAALSMGCGARATLDDGNGNASDAGNADEPTVIKELVCASDFCGIIVDKATGATADCGSCQGYSQCGDNGIANVCGSACMPLTAPNGDGGTYLVTPACDLAFGFGWASGYGTQMQFPGTCIYTNPATCIAIDNQVPQGQPCAGTVCGPWICCADDPDAGFPALLPGAVATNDGGLP